MDKPFIIEISVCAAAAGYFLFKGTSLKETADNIYVELLTLPKIHRINGSVLKIESGQPRPTARNGQTTVHTLVLQG